MNRIRGSPVRYTHDDEIKIQTASPLWKRSMPSTICVVCMTFAILLAFDIINIQINTRIVGSGHRTAEQDSTALAHCEEAITQASLSSQLNSEASDVDAKTVERAEHMSSADYNSTAATGILAVLKQSKKIQKVARNEALKESLNQITFEQVRASGMTQDMLEKFKRKRGQNSEDVEQKYTFKMHEPNSLEFEDMEWCPGLRQVDMKPIDEKFKFLFILGAQKGGTTWLHQALMKHPAFTEATSAYMGGWQKEVRFFNAMPTGSTQQYLDQFPSRKRLRALYNIPTVFLDSTPNSLFSPTVAPKVKQAIPHAKFVIVLRDPVARTVSSHNMQYNAKVLCYGKVCSRPTQPLLQEFRKHRDLGFRWPEDLSGCNFNEMVEPHERKTWGDCWRCDHFVYSCPKLSEEEAEALGGCEQNMIPHTPTIPLTQYGLYAAQIAWWMSFFPPETFLILTSEELQDSERALKALNKVLVHVGYPDARPFTEKMVGKINGFTGTYTGDMSEDDQQALKEITEFFEQPNKDLQTLMDTYFPDTHFTGFTPEYTEDSDEYSPQETAHRAAQKADSQKLLKRLSHGRNSA